jgi:protein phosphatase PTC7
MVFNGVSFLWRPSVILSRSFPSTRFARRALSYWAAATPTYGVDTPASENPPAARLNCPFRLETGYALCPKRPSRPFPPPFLSLPSSSFSDPLTTHDKSQDRRPSVDGQIIRGLTNGDDAILVTNNYIGVNDGVGAWAKRPQGHAA